MPRTPRIIFPDAWYHVMNRGAGRQDIFHNETYCYLFLQILNEAHKKFQVEVHSYCLMTNHYHLLVKTPLPNLSHVMQFINGMFTRKYNYLNKSDGPLFKGRYTAKIVTDDSYMLQASRYIHLNPVSANLCQDPENYLWSSYRFYIQNNIRPPWLFCDKILEQFQIDNKIESYKKFVLEGINNVNPIQCFEIGCINNYQL